MNAALRALRRLVYPLGFSSLLIGSGALLWLLRWRRVGPMLVFAGLTALWLFSTPMFANQLGLALESRYPERPIHTLPTAEVIVVLGGAFSHRAGRAHPDMSGSADRYWHAARLYHAGRAERIILSGGRYPWRGPGLTGAAAGVVFLRDLGVSEQALWLDDQALSTRENAVNVAAMLADEGLDTILLVTSASHMPRSMGAFRALGLEPIPVPTDFRHERLCPRASVNWLPSADALALSTRAVHEYVGWWLYARRGWI